MNAAAQILDNLAGALVRRYCGCGSMNRCVCGLPRPASGWTVERLEQLKALSKGGADLATAASALGETAQRCNRALDAMIGRSPTHALAFLERQAARS